MARWPKSKGVQALIATVAALLAEVCVYASFVMASFNNFYFGPHKAYPYPYADVHAAQTAIYRESGLTLLVVFAVVFTIQRLFTAAHRK